MFEISQEDIYNIQTDLLGQYRSFTREQIGIIQYEQSGDIVACPGSGKTTVLIAKIAILLKKFNEKEQNQGICVITHTNVGVEEILSKLRSLGINQVSYPHFIGTIHEFLNSFFAIKAYSILSKNDKFFFLENDDYKVQFERYFNKYKPAYWKYTPPFSAIEKTRLSINNDENISLIGFEDKSYRSELLNTFKDMFYSGYLRHSDTITLAKYYVNKHSRGLKKAFESRFKYFFVDETQDTSVDQYGIIENLFDENLTTIIQRFGDPYQALYNLYYGEPDAWIPSVEERMEIATSNRFGENIAKILRTTCIERYDHLTGSELVESIEPHIFLYNDPSKVLNTYCRVIDSLNLPLSKNKVYAVAQHHNAVSVFFENYQKVINDKKNRSGFAECLNQTYKIMSRTLRSKDSGTGKLRYSSNRLDELLNKEYPILHSNFRSCLIKIIKKTYLTEDTSSEIEQLEDIYGKMIKDSFKFEIENDELAYDISRIKDCILNSVKDNNLTIPTDANIYHHNETMVYLNTVHGVKGETHQATLLLESEINREEFSDLTDILPYLFGGHDIHLAKEQGIKDTLKLAYVALSRPTHFVGIAMKEENLTQEDVETANRYGWKIIKVEEYELV
ncbi:UvrD-helicase domain-containing protein [Paenibacillus odorifer]|uniref:UvrD-helicase domain-containing protein n=1 Tax=Paenibacillus odorifer TaxID=189426 RepID=UPI00096F0AFE|nr:UvrD-helicase domain-containing protein [Paenibacillus odorifer]OME10700.1 hypothetical protein BSK60_23620 [Paenibacillus odorifer]